MSDLLVPERLIHGHGKLELFDARSLKKVQEVPFENFIGIATTEYNAWKARETMGLGMPAGFTGVADIAPPNPISALFLTDSTALSDAATERVVPGVTLGYATKTQYTGTNVYRGTQNLGESSKSKDLVKWVFDWPTHAALGTIGSMCWAPVTDPATLQPFPNMGYDIYMGSVTPAYQSCLDPANGDGFYLANNASTVTKIVGASTLQTLPWTGGTLVMTLSLSTSNIVVVGADLWCINTASPYQLFRVAKAGPNTILQTITKPWAAASGGWVTSDGTSLYCAALQGTTIYKLNPADGTTITSWAVPNGVFGLTWDTVTDSLLVLDQTGAQGIETTVKAVTFYSSTGTLKFNRQRVYATGAGSTEYLFTQMYGFSAYGGKIYYSISNSNGTPNIRMVTTQMGARTRLITPVNKTNLTTMKATYQFNFAA